MALPEPPKVAPKALDSWTLRKAFDFATETPKREGGFAGQKCTPEFHWRPVERYFGAEFPIDQIRRDTDDERALRKAGRDAILPRTLDGFVKALRDGSLGQTLRNGDLVQRGRAYKDASVDRVFNTLRKTIKLAVKRKRLAALPEFPARLSDAKHKIRFFSDEEEAALLSSSALWFVEFMTVAIDTGLRVSELQALERTDVDFKVGILLVHGRDARGTKNGEFRSTPMTSRVRAIMQRRCLHGWESFGHEYGTLRKYFQRVRARLGLARDALFTIHTARHTCASRLVQRGVDILIVKEWLGHKDINTTLRYAHLRPQNLLAVVHVLEPQAQARAA